jgi:hypothetical protein
LVPERRHPMHDNKIEAYLERWVAAAPPLTNEQRAVLAELLEPVKIKSLRAHQRGDAA